MDRNFILAIVLSMGVLLIWDLMVAGPQREAMKAAREAQAVERAEQPGSGDLAGLEGVAATEQEIVTLDEALAMAPGRVLIETPSLEGSINLQGGRIDDLSLT